MRLDRLRSLIREFDALGTLGGFERPDTSGVRGKGSQRNFVSVDMPDDWPYDSDEETVYGHPIGPRGLDRGTPSGEDFSGGPPTPSSTYDKTWQTEAMGSPSRIGPIAPMDGPINSFGADAGPVRDANGEPIEDDNAESPQIDDMDGPGNMWGGPGTIPGTSGGWATAPFRRYEMKIREFFDPKQPPIEELENPAQDYMSDSTDEEMETRVDQVAAQAGEEDGFDPHIGDDGDPERFTSRLGGNTDFDMANPGHGTEFLMTPDKLGSGRGIFGMKMDSFDPEQSIGDVSAWDDVELIFRARRNQQGQPQQPTAAPTASPKPAQKGPPRDGQAR